MAGPQEATIQKALHVLEGSAGQRALRATVSVLVLLFILVGYNIRSFRNMASQEAMDSAQLARNLASGEGYTTKFIRPLSMHLQAQKAREEAGGLPALQITNAFRLQGGHPDISNPPVYPVALAGVMKVLPFEHDSLTPRSFWYRDNRFWRHQPDFLIGLFNQSLMLTMMVLAWVLARRLFDEETAWLAALALLGTEILWRFSVSGLSTMLVMCLVTGLFLVLHLLEAEGRQTASRLPRLLLLSVGAGLLVGVAGLTRYSMLWLIIPVLAFMLLFIQRARWVNAGLALVAVLLVASPWLARNHSLSGNWFGTAGYAVVEETGLLTEHRLQRSLHPDMSQVQPFLARYKIVSNLRGMTQNELMKLGGTWLAWLFAAGLLVAFRNPAPQRLRWFLLMALVTLAVVQAGGATRLSNDVPEINSENLMVLLLPMMAVYGVAFFLMLLDNIKWPELVLRRLVIVVFLVLMSLPLILTLAPPRPNPVAYPPYFPPNLQKIARWYNPDELVMSDVPWAVAWYANRPCVWLTLDVQKDFYELNDFIRPVKGLYLSPLTTDARFVSSFTQPSQLSWGAIVLNAAVTGRVPEGFPLRSAPTGEFIWPQEIFLADWDRWRASGN